MSEMTFPHHADRAWDRVMADIRQEMARCQVHPSRVVVLLPYAQLIQEAQIAWRRGHGGIGSLFLPRFETTLNWSRSLGGLEPDVDELRMEMARDALTAAALLRRAGLGSQQDRLTVPLTQAAWSLASVGAAVPPTQRTAWGERLGHALAAGMQAPVLALESATARIALAWAAASTYPSDPVFSAVPDLLVILEGFHPEPMNRSLRQLLGDRVLVLPLVQPLDPVVVARDARSVSLQAAQDAEDEAQRAAACVLAHLAAGRSPVALVALDRVLTRRVRAMLGERGVTIRDETGWKLSTTRAAAALMSLLRAQVWDASTDAVLDWLKQAPAFESSAVAQAEASWRRAGARDWLCILDGDALVQRVNALRAGWQAPRQLVRWLADLRAALHGAGQWQAMASDPAGQAVLETLRLREGAELTFSDVDLRMSLREFTNWVGLALEGANFLPRHAATAQVVILPLSQLLGRPLAAVVLPGCDEVRLPTSPEPTGPWTPEQRSLLGLASREQLAAANRAGWNYAMEFPCVDILWRTSEGGEHLMASGFVQELELRAARQTTSDSRALRAITPQACAMPAPRGDALPLTRLSSTAYEDLRRCPYRFFALRQLGLQASDELDLELGKRDFGNWLHCVLKLFHEMLRGAPTVEMAGRVALMNAASERATLELGLSEIEFLPFAAAWPRVRTGYLDWLLVHEASGATFVEGEAWKETPLGGLTLVGKIDRIDRLINGEAMVIDYKTESSAITAERIKNSHEDTQLAFYGALLSDDTLSAAYVNVGEKGGTRGYAQDDVVALRDHLLQGIVNDMGRIAAGAAMPALGEGQACEYCAARGLCRKDFWELG